MSARILTILAVLFVFGVTLAPAHAAASSAGDEQPAGEMEVVVAMKSIKAGAVEDKADWLTSLATSSAEPDGQDADRGR